MAILNTPLLSFSARGKIARTLVYMGWKGLNTVRQYVTPANPKTAAQVAQRDIMSAVVHAWRAFFNLEAGRGDWTRQASVEPSPMSGFNSFTKNAAVMAQTNPNASFCRSVAAAATKKVNFTMKNLDDGDTGDEAGDFEYWEGTSPDSLLKVSDIAIAAGVVAATSGYDAGTVIYAQLRKDSVNRSGITKQTVLA